MHSQVLALISALAAGAVAQQDAPVTTNNPVSRVFKATLPQQRFFAPADLNGNVQGGIVAQTPANGTGVWFQVSLSNFPTSGGPYTYHIHAKPALEGNCTSTEGHLDPYAVGEDHVCDPSKPEECQVGDLSGKHGKITTDDFTVSYFDAYASTDPANPAYFGDKSFVVHYANKTRITCANFAGSDGPSLAVNGSLAATPSGGNAVASGGAPGSTSAPVSGALTAVVSSATLVGGVVATMACLAL